MKRNMALGLNFFKQHFPQAVHISKIVYSLHKDIFVACFIQLPIA